MTMIIPVSSVKSRKRIFRSCKRNFIGVIVDQRNNINLIGTQRPEWTIKRMIWIWKFATDHIDVDQVKNNKEIIHRKAVYALSGYKDI